MVQISPRTPAPFLTPQQPTARDTVRPSRAARCRDFRPFAHDRVIPVAWKPVSVSPDFPLHKLDWVEGGVAAPSALRSMASPITGTTLQRSIPVDWRSTGTEVHERVWGWQPRHIQESVWTADPFTDRITILSVILKITIRAPVIGIFIDREGNRHAYSADSFLSPRVRHHLLSGQTPIPSWPGITGE